VSRIVKHLGVSTAVTLLPAISLLAYNVLAFLPQLFLVMGAKVVEKGTDYSLSNTVRNMLFLPCSREEKYSAKQAIDSFFFRMGDVVSAGLVFVGTAIGLAPAGFAKINILLAAAWLALAVLVGRAYIKRSAVPSVAGIAAAKPVTA
jgi:AAA family ATP:ADP antiporter